MKRFTVDKAVFEKLPDYCVGVVAALGLDNREHNEALEKLLDEANITTNKNAVPNDPQSPFITSGLRLGTPAMTTRGFKEADVEKTVEAIALVLDNPEDEAAHQKARDIVKELCEKYPLY